MFFYGKHTFTYHWQTKNKLKMGRNVPKNGNPHFNVLNAIYDYSSIIVDAFLLPYNSESIVWWCFFHTRTQFYTLLAAKEWTSNWEECCKKDGRPYLIVLGALNNHCSIIGDAILQPNNSKSTFVWFFSFKTHNFTQYWDTKS